MDGQGRNQVVPVKLSPEDQARAAKAPEGMVFVKGGCFMMGTQGAQTDEQPEHEACLDDFFMDKYETTQARWKKLMGSNPSKFAGDDLPVEQVNYFDIQEFIKKSNGECRLPTEAEWEYAAGGGAKTRYYWGNLMDETYAWFEDNSGGKTHPVGQKPPNQFGLYDMMGNVWEWTEDWYAPIYSKAEKQNPKGPATGENKAVRGGSFDSSAGALRLTNRTWLNPQNRVYSKISTYGGIVNEIYNYIGFRCAKSIESAPSSPAVPARTPASAPQSPSAG
ncbi:MAG: formylglycine-generating enzyme family protein [Nitrospinae bacterium]|nr:formylglycine-generating enzyme family protein [Nitrospinota bacterium]